MIEDGEPPVKQTALQATLQTQVARWFRSLDPVRPEEMIGLWKGLGHPSGHPLDGVLENLHWFGKRIHTDLRADALLFEGEPGRLVPVDPKFFPTASQTGSLRSAGPPAHAICSRTSGRASAPKERRLICGRWRTTA